MTQAALAEKAGVSLPTIRKMEAGKTGRVLVETLERIESVLRDAGIEFIPENGGGEGVRRRK
jgi:transcriptional regulator with XRE-family HTH domain